MENALAASVRRWLLTSAATADAAEQRSAGWARRRGNAAGLGVRTFVTRLSLATLPQRRRGARAWWFPRSEP